MTAATPHRRPSSDEFREFMDFLEGDERPSVNNDGDDESSITSNGGDLSKSSSRFGGPSRRVSFSSGIMLQDDDDDDDDNRKSSIDIEAGGGRPVANNASNNGTHRPFSFGSGRQTEPDQFLLESFNAADTDNNGELSADELKGLLHTLGLDMGTEAEDMNQLMKKIDQDNNDTIDFEEFSSIFKTMNEKQTSMDELLRETFDLYDADGSGDIDKGELRLLMAQLGFDLSDSEVNAMIQQVDGDGGGTINYEEFVSLFTGIHSNEEGNKPSMVKRSLDYSTSSSNCSTSATRGENIFEDAKNMISFSPILRFVMWLYSERQMILLACSHFVATIIIWAHYAVIRYDQQQDDVPEDASRYWAKRIIPSFLFGSKHAILFQMALIPLSMSRYTIAALSNSKLNHFLPLNKAVQAHIYLGYVMFGLSILATIMFFAFLGLLCSEGESDACNKLTSEIMITGYFMIGLLLIMTVTAYFRHNIPYELFYRVHILFLVVYTLTAAHTADAAHRSGEKERYQSYKWFVATLLYYFCDILVMRFNHRFTTRIKSFVSVEGHEGSKMVILRIKRPTLFNFQPGQYAFLRSKDIDYAWHPFSIASEPETQILEFYIEVFDKGSWTERLWKKLKNNTGKRMNIEVIGPYGAALVKEPIYTNVVVVGSGTGIVPCFGILKQHARRMRMVKPEEYLIGISEHVKRTINILGAQEDKDLSVARLIFNKVKMFMTATPEDELLPSSGLYQKDSFGSLKSNKRREKIRKSIDNMYSMDESVYSLDESMRDLQRNASFVNDALAESAANLKMATRNLKINVFKAMTSMYLSPIMMLVTLYGVSVFSLCLSWNLTSADISSERLSDLHIMVAVLHAIFFLFSYFVWNMMGLQSYVDVILSFTLPFIDFWYFGVKYLTTGQTITLSLVNGYIVYRFYQKTMDSAAQTQTVIKESVERLRFIWTVRTVSVARQLYSEINSVYESLVEEWGEEYAAEVLDVSIYITDRDREEASSFRAEIRNTLLYQSRKVLFIRPKLPQMINNHLMQLFKTRPSHSCTLLAFCGGPQLSRIIGEAISEAQLLSAATGYGSHTIDYVSESYGGVKKSAKQASGHVSSKAKKGVDASELWGVVKSESVRIINTQRVKAVFEDDGVEDRRKNIKEYNSRREMIEDYRNAGTILRYRGFKS